MFPGGNGNADLGYNKHAHGHGHGHGHSHNQFLAQPPPPPPHFSLPAGGGPGIVNPGLVMATSLPLAMQGGAGIDWAQLAQQWIHMRDAGPAAGINMPVSACPPPPVIGNVRDYHQQTMAMPLPSVVRAGYPILEEHGEADMDMDDDVNERGHGADTPPPPAPVVTQSQWLAVNETPAISVPATSEAAATLGKHQWSNWHTQPGKATTSTGNPTAHIPSLLKLNVSNPNEPHQQLQLQPSQQAAQPHQLAAHQQHQQQQSQQQHVQHLQHLESGSGGGASSGEIDANKRKMLPAWIREGLEKMEREKQRQLERQQSSSQVPSDTADAEIDVHVKQVSSKTLTTPVNLLNISNVASDSEDSIGLPAGAAALVGELKEQQIGNELLSKAPDGGGSSSSDEEAHNERNAGTQAKVAKVAAKGGDDVNGKNYEERLADLMLVVRRTLTEILLETTNEEITAIAGETLKAHRAKASSAQVIRKSALSSITGNLGLAAYGDSSSESEEDEDEEDGERQAADAGKDVDKSVHLSAEELKARIRRSKRSFERVIDDIEDRVAKQERRDEQTLQRHRKRELEQRSDAASEQRRLLANPDSLGETAASRPPHEKLQQYNGKRPSRKERTTRFSDNKDGKQQAHSYVQQVVAAAAAVAPLPSVTSGPPKLKPVPNPATNLLQMPESVATMLSAADKALNKVNKSSSRKSKSKRRHSSTSSSTSSSGGGSSSSSSDSDDSSNSNSDSGSKTSSSRSKRSTRHGHHRSHGSSSRSKYSRRDRHRERERERDRNRDRRHDRHHYSGGGGSSSSSHRQGQRRHRGSSHSAEDDGGGSSSYHRSSRQSSSRGHDQHGSSSSTSGRQRHRTRSRSKSRSTHQSSSNAYTSSSSASHSRKRH